MKLPEKDFYIFVIALLGFMFISYAQHDPAFGENRSNEDFLIQKDSLIDAHNDLRSKIELQLTELDKTEILAVDMPEDFQAKWKKLHFYADKGELRRVKTYSKNNERSEEFYYSQDGLFMAVVEDEGSTKLGAATSFNGKRYYYANDQLAYESKSNLDAELIQGDPNPEELKKEGAEYWELFENKLKN